jgi:hypothetical protein
VKASELTFGLKLEREAPLWWGARAISAARTTSSSSLGQAELGRGQPGAG